MDGHADAPASLQDLASFLVDTPETESENDEQEDPTADEPTPGNEDTDEDATAGEEESDDESEEEAEETPPPERKIKVVVKGDNGEDSELEVDEQELIKGYHRQADYTKKTQALAEREAQAVEFLRGKHTEISQQYLNQAELARAAMVQFAGIRSPEEMAQLAHDDPAAWVAENQRNQTVATIIGQLDSQISAERERAKQDQEARQQQDKQARYQKAWSELEKAKIDAPALMKIYEDGAKAYGFTAQELAENYDHRLVMMMRDAAAYKALQAQKGVVTRKAQDAPKMPSKAAVPAQERRNQKLNERFKGGRGKLNDLAALLR
jgi:hypothetical protein